MELVCVCSATANRETLVEKTSHTKGLLFILILSKKYIYSIFRVFVCSSFINATSIMPEWN